MNQELSRLINTPEVRSALRLDQLQATPSLAKRAFGKLLSCLSKPENQPDFKPGVLNAASVFLIPQVHKTPNLSPLEQKEVLSSQHQIAYFLSTVKEPFIVLAEQIKNDLTRADLKSKATAAAVKEIRSAFPKGIPVSVDDLSAKQKTVLSKYEGSYVGFTLAGDNVESVRKAEDSIAEQFFFAASKAIIAQHGSDYNRALEHSPALRFLMLDFREVSTIDHVITVANDPNNFGKTICLIYGASHANSFYTKLAGAGLNIYAPDCFMGLCEGRQVVAGDLLIYKITEDRKKPWKERVNGVLSELGLPSILDLR